MSTRTKEEIQEIWTATNTPHTKSNRPPRLTKKEKKLIDQVKKIYDKNDYMNNHL